MEISVLVPGSRYKKKIYITQKGDQLWLRFGYNRPLLDEVKTSFDHPKWHGFDTPPIKQWSVKDSTRTHWCLDYLQGKNPYKLYQKELVIPDDFERPVYEHQKVMVAHLLQRLRGLLAAEMGTGKTLAVIEAMERSGVDDWLYVAPRSALYSVQLEFLKWESRIQPLFVTYASLHKYVGATFGGVVFDESHKLKTPTTKRSIAAMSVADTLRDSYIWLMTGSPAPKAPTDWWHQCEVAQPGYLREGSIYRFKERLAITQEAEDGLYDKLIAWRDDDKRCSVCGMFQDHENHDTMNSIYEWFHEFKPGVNEVRKLYRRMKGLVLVQFKDDCLDLPEKEFITLKCPPNKDLERAASLIVETSPTVIQALTLLRELSDGFQYKNTVIGKEVCDVCKGTGILTIPEEQPCPQCKGTGKADKIARSMVPVDSPKLDLLKDLIEEHEEARRIIIYAGFTGSIDRVVDLVKNMQGWDYIRMDGRGTDSSLGGNTLGLLQDFQNLDLNKRIAFIGHPGAAGTGLNLTASPSIIYYSNSFNAADRIQSMDRIHRPGCRGAKIYDLINLKIDQYVLDNLLKKRELQSISMGELKDELNN